MRHSNFISMLETTLADPLALFRAEDRPLAYVGFDVPIDVLAASGRAFCHLPWQKGRATPHADRWLETAFPGWARSIVEDWYSGAFDCFERVIFTRGDDATQRLYYYLCELQRRGVIGGPRPCIFDVALVRRAASITHCKRALLALMAELDIDTAALIDGIGRANRQRAWFGRVDSERCAAGHVYENISRAALFRDMSLTESAFSLEAAVNGGRLLLAGSVPPDDMFHRAVEACGWNIVHEAHQLTLGRHGEPLLDIGQDPVGMLAQHFNAHSFGSRTFADRATSLVYAGKKVAANAVVLWLTEEDEALAWDVPRQRTALAETGLPHLVLTRRRWDGNDGAAEQICRFLQELSQ